MKLKILINLVLLKRCTKLTTPKKVLSTANSELSTTIHHFTHLICFKIVYTELYTFTLNAKLYEEVLAE